MTGDEAYKQKFLTDDALDAAVSAYLADPSKPAVIEIGKGSIDVAAAVPSECLQRRGAGPGGRDGAAAAACGENGGAASPNMIQAAHRRSETNSSHMLKN
jgi:hypothetical protein